MQLSRGLHAPAGQRPRLLLPVRVQGQWPELHPGRGLLLEHLHSIRRVRLRTARERVPRSGEGAEERDLDAHEDLSGREDPEEVHCLSDDRRVVAEE